MRMIDLLKTRQITALLASLTGGAHAVEQSEVGISSLIDTRLMLRNLEQGGERTRTLSIIKSRGMKHSHQTRELLLTDRGIDLAEVFIGPDGGILTWSARLAQETDDRAAAAALKYDIAHKAAAILRKRKAIAAGIAEMEADVTVLPTMIKSQPFPLRRMIGDLSDEEQVLLGLGLEPEETNPNDGTGDA
jgi:circadian clock protein KaiC